MTLTAEMTGRTRANPRPEPSREDVPAPSAGTLTFRSPDLPPIQRVRDSAGAPLRACRNGLQNGSGNGIAEVTIEYCPLANYGPVAHGLADAIHGEFEGSPVETRLVPAAGGVYEVLVNGKLVFSKKATYRLPDAEEIFYHVREALGRSPTVGPFVPPSG